MAEVPRHRSSGCRKADMATVKTMALMERAGVRRGGVGRGEASKED